SGRTLQIDVTNLKRLFEFARERGWIWGNPMTEIKKYKAKTKKIQIPTSEEVQKILFYLRGREFIPGPDGKKAADFIEFLCLSGVRCQGAQTVQWEDIDFDRGIMLVTEKGSKTREVNLFPGLRTWLETRRKPKGLLFPRTHRVKK